MSATLATLRDRIQVQLQAASGWPEPLVVTASSATLATLRDRVEATLADASNARWSTDDVDEAIRKALEQYNRFNPQRKIGTINVSSSTREHSLSGLTGLTRVEKVWWDYDSTTPGYPPNWRQFEVWPGAILYIDDDDCPANGDVIRVWYTLPHTLNGLDAAGATTVPNEDIGYLVTGAAHFAAQQRAVELAETLNVDKDVVKRLEEYAEEQGKNFRYGVRVNQPAWQRRAKGYPQEDIDEAIRWAMHRYTQVKPHRAIGTITLSASGREISLSSLTGLLTVERVWWDYDSSDPDYPPKYRDFEEWPGSILFIRDDDEPDSGDVVRVWYSKDHTLNGLDSETTTTLPTNHETVIVTGAAGYAAAERVQEEPMPWGTKKIREWAKVRLKEFERMLETIARQEAARHSGIAPSAALDRWDGGDGMGWA